MAGLSLLAALLFVVPVSTAWPAAVPVYERDSVKAPGRLINIAMEDLDGDGLKDLVTFSVFNENRRNPFRAVSVFYQKRGAGFSAEPDQSWRIAPDAAVFDIGPAPGAPGKKAIGFMAPDGILAYMPEGRSYGTRPVQLVKAESVFGQADPTDMPRWRFFVDSKGQGPNLCLLPGINRLTVYAVNGSLKPSGSLPLTVMTSFSEPMQGPGMGPLTISHRVPEPAAIGFNSPAGTDLFVTWDDCADVWTRKNGGYSETPALRFRPGLLESGSRDTLDSAWVQATDMQGDGRCDLLVTKVTGGVAQAKSLLFIYMRGRDGSMPERPNQTIITEGVVGPKLADLNGDGRKDIILPTVKWGIANFVNMLTSKTINMNLGIYLQDASGRFPDRPNKEKSISFKLDVKNLGKGSRPVMSVGRFTKAPGSGLAVVSKEDRVSIYLPDRYSYFSDNPGLNIKVEAPTELFVTDLNGDGIDDLVMTYRKSKDGGGKVNVFISK